MPTEPVLPENELRSGVLQHIEDGRLPLMLSTHIDGRRKHLAELKILLLCGPQIRGRAAPERAAATLTSFTACHSAGLSHSS
jgi:hypothetical protein